MYTFKPIGQGLQCPTYLSGVIVLSASSSSSSSIHDIHHQFWHQLFSGEGHEDSKNDFHCPRLFVKAIVPLIVSPSDALSSFILFYPYSLNHELQYSRL